MTLGEIGLHGLMCRKKAFLHMPSAVAIFNNNNKKKNVEKKKKDEINYYYG